MKKIVSMLNKYHLVVAAILIYGYYLTTSLNVFHRSTTEQLSFFDFVVEYDSLFWMWLATFVFVKLQQAKERHFREQTDRIFVQTQLEKTGIASRILNDVTAQLQDTINNPLAVIKVMTQDIRKRFAGDADVTRNMDQIDSALRRVHDAIKDVSVYESNRLLEAVHESASAHHERHLVKSPS